MGKCQGCSLSTSLLPGVTIHLAGYNTKVQVAGSLQTGLTCTTALWSTRWCQFQDNNAVQTLVLLQRLLWNLICDFKWAHYMIIACMNNYACDLHYFPFWFIHLPQTTDSPALSL